MKKTILLGVSLLALTLTACDTSNETSSSNEPVVMNEEKVVNLLSSLSNSSVNGYQLTLRKYTDNFLDGTVYDNSLVVTNLDIYNDGYDGTTYFYTNMDVPTALTSDSVIEGRYASYLLDEDYYVVGFESKGEDKSQNYYSYEENHMYVDLKSNGLSNFTTLLNDVTKSFVTPELMWAPDYNFTINDVEINLDENNNFECTISAFAPEDDWYSAEEGIVKVIVSSDGTKILNMSFEIVVYDRGFSSDVDLHANNYSYAEISNIRVGEVLTEEITPFNVEDFSADQIYNSPSHIVNNINEGELSEKTVQDILDNYTAYIDGVTYSSADAYIVAYYDYENMVDYGAANVTQEKQAYLNNILITTTTYDFVNEEYSNLVNYKQTVAAEDGIQIMSGSGDSYTGSLITPDLIYSFDSYLSASPIIDDFSITEAFGYIAEYGFKETVGEYTTNNATLKSASKEGSIINLSFTYSASYPGIYDDTYEIEIVIEDNFMKTVNCDKQDGSYNHYTLSKDELSTFNGELIPFELTEFQY